MLVIFKFTHICTSIFYHISSCNLAFPCDIVFLLLDMHLLRRSPREENGNPLQYSLPGKSHGQRNLVGYSP